MLLRHQHPQIFTGTLFAVLFLRRAWVTASLSAEFELHVAGPAKGLTLCCG